MIALLTRTSVITNRCRARSATLALALVVSLSSSCTGGSDSPSGLRSVASVSLDKTTATIAQGALISFVATPRDANGTALPDREVTWSSESNSIATVTQTGVVTGVSVGTTTIRATSEGKQATAQVTVTPAPVASITLDRTVLSLEQSTTTTLVATMRDGGGRILNGRNVSWSSDNNGIATVDQSGVVTAVAVGIANITATSEGKHTSAQVTVTPIPVNSVVLNATNAELTVGETATFTAETRSAAGQLLTGRNVAWTAADVTVVSVANGVVTALAPGTTTITATSEGKSATATIKVNPRTCASTVATGRLVATSADEFTYTTVEGWTISITRNRLRILSTHPGPTMNYEWWGSIHENIGGKHIKDLLNNRRTILLPGGVIITGVLHDPLPANSGSNMEWVKWFSIYEGNETHRIDMQTFAVTQSCALPMFGEADEHDGEAMNIYFNETGMRAENVYQQDATPAGVPLNKIFGTFPLAQTSFANPNQVIDFFDDPRLGHTW